MSAHRPATFSIRTAKSDDVAAIRRVLLAVRTEYAVHCEHPANDADLEDIERNYFARGGHFEVVADAAGTIVGCAGLLPLTPGRAELCKMYLQEAARGRGLGRQLLDNALAAARRGGFAEVWLETNSTLADAIALYRCYGFEPVPSGQLLPRCDRAYLLRLSPRR
jgi:putative acetyltransferase